jgi:hypothetical protein
MKSLGLVKVKRTSVICCRRLSLALKYVSASDAHDGSKILELSSATNEINGSIDTANSMESPSDSIFILLLFHRKSSEFLFTIKRYNPGTIIKRSKLEDME